MPTSGRRPVGSARVLMLGWGSTWGPIAAAVRAARQAGHAVAQHPPAPPQPVPRQPGEVLAAYDRVIVPEMNLGQLALLLRAKYLVDVRSHTAVQRTPSRQPNSPTSSPRRSRSRMTIDLGMPQLLANGPEGRHWRPTPPSRPGTSPPTRRCAGARLRRLRHPATVQGFLPELGLKRENVVSSPASGAPRGSRTTSRPTACTRSTDARRRSRRPGHRPLRPVGVGRHR